MSLTNVDEMEERIREIHALQKKVGMTPRDDSRLTRQYAEGRADPEFATVQDVVHELYIVDGIFRCTLYGEVIEDVMRMAAAEVRRRYRVTWSVAWDIVRFYVPTMLKLHMLRRSGVQLCGDGASHEILSRTK